ncbi:MULTISPECIES: hypothetical protein [unclassified Streptomyces]|uniref:hypothetical protein n=1 Tax=unclassified Streptomyces TaxID=2593676 RepID=UPI0036E6AE73
MAEHRIVSRDFPDGRRIIAAVTDEPGRPSDEEMLDTIQADMDKRRERGQHLRVVDDPQ